MDVQEFLANFETIAEAPGGIARLRSLVFDLAFRGKLIDQEPSEGTSFHIVSESRKTTPIESSDTSYYEIPPSWSWTTIGCIADQRLGKMLDASKNKGLPKPYLRNINVRWFDFDLSNVSLMRFEESEFSEFALKDGDILVCEGGEPGRAAIWDARETEMFFQKALHRIRPVAGVYPKFLLYLLRSDSLSGRMEPHFTGATIKHLTGRALERYPVPLPPTKEQLRIVAKVDELMALCDQLEERQAKRDCIRKAMQASVLESLAVANDTADLSKGWAQVVSNWPQLSDHPDVVTQLRKTGLKLAFRGLLVPQEPTDEPVDMALARLEKPQKPARYASRSQLLMVGDCGLSVNNPATELPKGWAWTPLIDIAQLESGHTPSRSRPDWWGGDVPWIGVVDARIHNGGIITETLQHTNAEGVANSSARILPKDTVCISRTASVGYVIVMGRPMATSQDFVNWVPTESVSPRWLQLLFIAELDALSRFGKGAVHQTIYFPEWISMHVALPPLAEQHRIVAKVDELMALCDQLESGLKRQQETAAALAAAMCQAVIDGAGASAGSESSPDLLAAGARSR